MSDNAPSIDLQEAAADFRDACAKALSVSEAGDPRRDIFITPFYGHYGLAGYTISILGSPLRTLIIWDLGGGAMTLLTNGKAAKLEPFSSMTARKPSAKHELFDATVNLIRAIGWPEQTGTGFYKAPVYIMEEGVFPVSENS